MRILVAEDDPHIAAFLQRRLEQEHFQAEIASDGQQALAAAQENDFDLLVLDLSLPTLDGEQVLRRVRMSKPQVPIFVLSARQEVPERVRIIDAGADDFLTKPFSFLEFSARVRALLRRRTGPADPVMRVADLEMNRLDRRVSRAGRVIELTHKEYVLLECLMQSAGRVVTRAAILERVWTPQQGAANTNIVDVYVNYLRRKVEPEPLPSLIHTVRGMGYQLGPEPEE